MSSKAIIFGYGYTAQSIDKHLTEAGYKTFGVRRDWSGKENQNINSTMVEANLTNPDSFQGLPDDPDVLVNCASSGSRGDANRYRKVYFNGSKNLIEWATGKDPDLVLWTGSSSVYGKREGSWVDETSELKPKSESGEILRETEQLYREAYEDGLSTVIFRVSGIYGEGRTRSLNKLRSGQVSLSLEEANYYMNMIHRTDIGRSVARVAKDPSPGETYNIVDNEPITRRQFYVWLSQQLDVPLPKITGGGKPTFTNKRVSNEKFVSQYDYEFQFPNYKAGYRPILEKQFDSF